MGMEGASLATTISQFVTLFILSGFYFGGFSILRISPRFFHPSFSMLKTVTMIGIPSAVIQICLSVATSMTNIAAKSLADADLIIAACGGLFLWRQRSKTVSGNGEVCTEGIYPSVCFGNGGIHRAREAFDWPV